MKYRSSFFMPAFVQKSFYFLFAFLVLVVGVNKTGFGQITSFQSGAWNSNTTWVGGVIPSATDDVAINHIVTINSETTAEAKSVTINPDGKLIVEGTLIVTNNLTMNFSGNNESEFVMLTNSLTIVKGNVHLTNKVSLNISSYFIIEGNLTKDGATSQGDIVINVASIYVFGEVDPNTGLDTCDDYDNLTVNNGDTCHIGTETAFEENVDIETIPINIVEIVNNCASPSINNPGNQTFCDSYTLPPITGTNLSGNQKYYDDSQTNNGQILVGPITSTQTVWIYDETSSGCTDEESFVVTVNPSPTITLSSNETEVCFGDILASIAYSATTGSPDKYSIDFDTSANTAGFIDVVDATLVGSAIDIAVPATGAPATYQADLTVKNSTTGCISANYEITIIIHSLPVVGSFN